MTEREGSAEATDAFVLDWWKRYLNEKLSAAGAGLFGAGPWCLVGEPAVNRVAGPLAIEFPPGIAVTADPLPLCPDEPLPVPAGCEFPAGAEPRLSVETASVGFGAIPVGFDSAEQLLELANFGVGRLCLVTAGPSGEHPDDFVLDAPPGSPLDCLIDTPEERAAGRVFLEGGESCSLRLRFHPTDKDLRRAQLSVQSTDPVAPSTAIALSGTGQGGVLSVVPPSPVCVPPVAGGCYERRIELRNDGPGRVRITDWPSNEGWLVSSYAPWSPGPGSASLDVGAALSATVRSRSCPPPATATYDAAVAGNAQNTPLTFALQPQTSPEVCTP